MDMELGPEEEALLAGIRALRLKELRRLGFVDLAL
jgi:hypothetical protein